MKRILSIFFVLSSYLLAAQPIDSDLQSIKNRMDSVASFSADLSLEVAIDFINMPPKNAKLIYEKGSPIKFNSESFAMVPKRGLDLTLQELFKYPFITVDRGMENRNGLKVKIINVIPTDAKADFAIATLYIDKENRRLVGSEINTKKNGTFFLAMTYISIESLFPNNVEISFEMERVKLPINFMGEDTKIDRKKMKADGSKTGKIYLELKNYQIKKIK